MGTPGFQAFLHDRYGIQMSRAGDAPNGFSAMVFAGLVPRMSETKPIPSSNEPSWTPLQEFTPRSLAL